MRHANQRLSALAAKARYRRYVYEPRFELWRGDDPAWPSWALHESHFPIPKPITELQIPADSGLTPADIDVILGREPPTAEPDLHPGS